MVLHDYPMSLTFTLSLYHKYSVIGQGISQQNNPGIQIRLVNGSSSPGLFRKRKTHPIAEYKTNLLFEKVDYICIQCTTKYAFVHILCLQYSHVHTWQSSALAKTIKRIYYNFQSLWTVWFDVACMDRNNYLASGQPFCTVLNLILLWSYCYKPWIHTKILLNVIVNLFGMSILELIVIC